MGRIHELRSIGLWACAAKGGKNIVKIYERLKRRVLGKYRFSRYVRNKRYYRDGNSGDEKSFISRKAPTKILRAAINIRAHCTRRNVCASRNGTPKDVQILKRQTEFHCGTRGSSDRASFERGSSAE